jgi:predicted small secreted protein
MRNIARIFLALAMLTGMGGLLAACHTTAGAGQDISATGHEVTKDANKLMP